MKIVLNHVFFRITELVRQPTYVVTTLIFPSMFFWFFGVPNATSTGAAQLLMASFSSFAILGVVLFQLAVSVSQERNSAWALYLKTLPLRSWQVMLAQLLTSILFSVFAVFAVIVTAHMTSTVDMPKERWMPFLLNLFVGGIPFASLGILIGLTCSPQTVIPVANMVYLPLSFAGGLWIPPNALPKVVQDISDYLPTRMYAEIVWSGALNKELKDLNIYGLALYAILFLVFSIYFYKKDEGNRFA